VEQVIKLKNTKTRIKEVKMKKLMRAVMVVMIVVLVSCCDWNNSKALQEARDTIKADSKALALANATLKVSKEALTKATEIIAARDKTITERDKTIAEKTNCRPVAVKATPPRNTHLITWKAKPAPAEKIAILKCDSKNCWPRNPKGNYFPLGKFGDIPLVGSVNNPIFKEENSISAKREFHGVWGKKMVARNLTVPLETLLAIPRLNREISDHFEKMGSQWPIDPSDKDGKVCDEKTWIINPATKTWSIRK
jgi:hypothetical protein